MVKAQAKNCVKKEETYSIKRVIGDIRRQRTVVSLAQRSYREEIEAACFGNITLFNQKLQ